MDSISQLFPGKLQIFYYILFYPIVWLLWTVKGGDESLILTIVKAALLTLPVLFICVGVFCTVISLVTSIFRPNRNVFIATILVTWWDGGQAILMFWAGLIKFLFLSVGWIAGAIRLVILGFFQTAKDVLFFPVVMIMGTVKGYAKPGIPWVAVFITFFWILLESMIFSFILTPMVVDIIAGLTNQILSRSVASTGLFLFLFMVIGGSFACMHGLVDAIAQKNIIAIIKMLFIEFVVMCIEVFFFYREFVDSLAPWFAQMTNDQVHMGAGLIITIATMAWFGVRASTWFFFAKYGTPTLLSIISREGMSGDAKSEGSERPRLMSLPMAWIRELTGQIQKDMDWFSVKSKEILSAFVLPPIQILAVMTNFGMILLTGKNLFNLPIKSLDELKDTKYMLEQITEKKKED